MDLDQIELTLLPAPDDPHRVCYERQGKLLAIQEDLRKHRVRVITVGARPSGDTHLGQFIITLGPGAIPAITAIATAWMETRRGRSVRLRLDDIEVEASTMQALEDLFEITEVIRGRLALGVVASALGDGRSWSLKSPTRSGRAMACCAMSSTLASVRTNGR